jgi:hypothetical protein
MIGRSSEFAPVEKARHYLVLNRNYLQEAEELLRQKDYVQASEKLWGAAAKEKRIIRGIFSSNNLSCRGFISPVNL